MLNLYFVNHIFTCKNKASHNPSKNHIINVLQKSKANRNKIQHNNITKHAQIKYSKIKFMLLLGNRFDFDDFEEELYIGACAELKSINHEKVRCNIYELKLLR